MDCFVINSKNIKTRFDPLYLRNIAYVNNIKSKYPLTPLGKLLKEPPQYGANETAIEGNKEKDIRYIRITDIDGFGNLKPEEWKTAQTTDKKYLLNENDILFARSGATAGKTFIYKNGFGKAIFAGYLIRFRFDETKVNPLFVFYYTQLQRYALWVKSIQRPSGQPNINSGEFKAFEIPLPPLETQNRIVSIMHTAYEQKEQKEQEAEKLLSSIDDFVLNELGIELPELNDKKCYTVNSEAIGERVDPYYYQPKFKRLYEAIKRYKKMVYLKDIVEELDYGLMPTQDYALTEDEGVPMIRVTNILQNGSIDMSDVKYIPFNTPRLDLKRIKENDVLMVQCGSTTGKIAIVPKEYENYTFGSFSFVIRGVKKIVSQHYLFAILLSSLVQEQIKHTWNIVTVRPNTSKPNVENLLIPLPSLDMQNKIADEVKKRMSEAEKLKSEADSVVEKAKQEVEIIILGK